MRFVDALEDQYVKVTFVRMTVLDTGSWQLQGDGGVSHALTSATDLASALTEADTWLSSNGYTQITYWGTWSTSQGKSVWVI